MRHPAAPYLTVLGLIWGTYLVVARFGVGQFGSLLFAGLRLTLAAVVLLAIYAVSSRQLPRDRTLWRHALIIGVVATAIPMMAVLSALQYLSAGLTALLITTAPAFISVGAHFFLPDERMNRFKFVGVTLALSGALLIVLQNENGLPDVSDTNPLGYLFVFIMLTFEAGGTIYVRRNMRAYDPFDVTALRITVAAVVVMTVALLVQGWDVSQVTGLGVASLLYAALIAAIIGQMLGFSITQRFGATTFSLVAYIIPIVSAIVGVILLGETISAWMIIGMFLIALGIRLINHRVTAQLVQTPVP